MSAPRPAAALLAAGVLLSGCVTVLPRAAPVQLYRFGAGGAAAPAAARPADVRGLVLSGVVLPRAAAGDGLLAVTGDEAAYIGGARWVSPAAVLMQEAAERAFDAPAGDAPAGRVRLLRRDDPAGAAGLLRLDVRDFETVYSAPGATPSVRVSVHAAISRTGGAPVAERSFSVDAPAAANRVSAIVPAYDAAVRQVLGEVVAWAGAAAQALPAAAPTTVTRTSTTQTVVGR